jgi:hypothetical protein
MYIICALVWYETTNPGSRCQSVLQETNDQGDQSLVF